MNTMLAKKVIIPKLTKVKNGIPSMKRLYTGTLLKIIRLASYSQSRKVYAQSVKRKAFFFLNYSPYFYRLHPTVIIKDFNDNLGK